MKKRKVLDKKQLFVVFFLLTHCLGLVIARMPWEEEFWTKDVASVGKDIIEGIDQSAKDVVEAFKKLPDLTYEEVLKPMGKELIDFEKRMEACASVIGYGTEWATAQAGLQLAKGALLIAQGNVNALGGLMIGIGTISSKTFNVQELTFEHYLSEIKDGVLPKAHIKMILFGKKIDITFQLDMKNVAKSLEKLLGKELGMDINKFALFVS